MERFFSPSSIAVLGASASPGKAGYNIVWNLRAARVTRGLYPINPNRDDILGFKAFPSLADIPAHGRPVDLVVICLPPRLVHGAVHDCIDNGARAIIIESGSLGDNTSEDERVRENLYRTLNDAVNPPRIMGPNSIGVIDFKTNVNTSLIPFAALPAVEARGIAIVGQTGLIASGYLQRILAEGLFPVSKVCCLGNKLDVNEVDVLDYLRRDPWTSAIAMYIEDVKDGRRFTAAAHGCLVGGKPVMIVKTGCTEAGSRAILSHTGSISGNDRVFDAAMRRCGATRVENFETLWIQAQFMHRAPMPVGRRVAVVSISGAGCALSADATASSGMSLPSLSTKARMELQPIFPTWFKFTNPIDLWAAIEQVGSKVAFATAIDVLLNSDFDAVIIINLAMPESLLDWDHLRRSRAAHPAKPVVLTLLGGHASIVKEWEQLAAGAGIPVVKSPDVALQALGRARRVAEWASRAGAEA